MMEEEVDERPALCASYFRLGLEPGVLWIPPKSFEERNLMWWLPGPRKRYPPRMPIGDPPLIRGPGEGRRGEMWLPVGVICISMHLHVGQSAVTHMREMWINL